MMPKSEYDTVHEFIAYVEVEKTSAQQHWYNLRSVKETKIYSFPDRLLRVRAFYNDLRQIPSFYLYNIKDNCLN
jgi:hypothetical protein